jgi:hypothetical protein
MDYNQMTSPCGIDCFNCPAYLANEDEKLRTRISKYLDIPSEQAICNGCRNENGPIGCQKMTEPCNVYKCIKKKNIKFCFDCSDFPCDHLHPYADKASQRPHNTKVFNLCLIKKMGLESWAKNKAKNVRDTYFDKKFMI